MEQYVRHYPQWLSVNKIPANSLFHPSRLYRSNPIKMKPILNRFPEHITHDPRRHIRHKRTSLKKKNKCQHLYRHEPRWLPCKALPLCRLPPLGRLKWVSSLEDHLLSQARTKDKDRMVMGGRVKDRHPIQLSGQDKVVLGIQIEASSSAESVAVTEFWIGASRDTGRRVTNDEL